MGGDLAAAAVDRVARAAERTGRGDERAHPAPRTVERLAVARAQAHERDEVGARPQAIHVRLGEADAAAQQGGIEGGGVDLEDGAERVGGIERAEAHGPAAGLAQLEHPAARQAQQAMDDRARDAMAPHRGASRGWLKYGAPLSFSRTALA